MNEYHDGDSSDHEFDIFVFGSNLAGIHGRGAALHAYTYYDAEWGIGEGKQGSSYALPTKDQNLKVLSLEEISKNIQKFLMMAESNPHKTFFVTRIGCGLAGYKDSQIAPMFKHAPTNCILPYEWKEYHGK